MRKAGVRAVTKARKTGLTKLRGRASSELEYKPTKQRNVQNFLCIGLHGLDDNIQRRTHSNFSISCERALFEKASLALPAKTLINIKIF